VTQQRPGYDWQIEDAAAPYCMTTPADVTQRLLCCVLADLRHQLSRMLHNVDEGTWEHPGIPMVNSIGNMDNNKRIHLGHLVKFSTVAQGHDGYGYLPDVKFSCSSDMVIPCS
jgi:hypothetical protein